MKMSYNGCKMNGITQFPFCVFILILHCSCFSIQNPKILEHYPKKHFQERTIAGDKLYQAVIQPLCFQEQGKGEVSLCGGNNTAPVCFHRTTSSFSKCKEKPLSAITPLCSMPSFNQQFVVSCTDSSVYVCFSLGLESLAPKFCRRSSLFRICLGKQNLLQPCEVTRFKREQKVPRLDVDGYYASCENCSLTIAMKVDEEMNERPIIEIRSEPLKDEEEEDKKKGRAEGTDDDEEETEGSYEENEAEGSEEEDETKWADEEDEKTNKAIGADEKIDKTGRAEGADEENEMEGADEEVEMEGEDEEVEMEGTDEEVEMEGADEEDETEGPDGKTNKAKGAEAANEETY